MNKKKKRKNIPQIKRKNRNRNEKKQIQNMWQQFSLAFHLSHWIHFLKQTHTKQETLDNKRTTTKTLKKLHCLFILNTFYQLPLLGNFIHLVAGLLCCWLLLLCAMFSGKLCKQPTSKVRKARRTTTRKTTKSWFFKINGDVQIISLVFILC